MSNGLERSREPAPAMLLMAACTLWLVIQNTALAVVLLWAEPQKVVSFATMLLKAVVIHG
jgi:hypothetical protein